MRKFEVGDSFTNNSGDDGVILSFIKGTKTIHRRCTLAFVDGTEIELPTTKLRGGSWKNPNKPIVYDIGYMGQGKYVSSHKRSVTRAYSKWDSMLQRCYSITNPNYLYYGAVGVTVCKEWHNFQNFAEWFYSMDKTTRNCSLDKDIRYPKSLSGKLYCPDYCCLVTQKVNNMMADISKIGVRQSNLEGVENYKVSADGMEVF